MLGKLLVLGRPTFWLSEGQGPTAFAVGAGVGCLDIFTFIHLSFRLSPCLGRRPDIDCNTVSSIE